MNIEQLVNEFAKQSKISKAKTMAFAQAILEQAKQELPKAGRKTSEESIRIREAIKQSLDELKEVGVFTTKEIAAKLKASQAYVGNNLRWLAEHEGIVKAAGKKNKASGERGRKECLWFVA